MQKFQGLEIEPFDESLSLIPISYKGIQIGAVAPVGGNWVAYYNDQQSVYPSIQRAIAKVCQVYQTVSAYRHVTDSKNYPLESRSQALTVNSKSIE